MRPLPSRPSALIPARPQESVPEWIAAIESYIAQRRKQPKPFIWTAQASDITESKIIFGAILRILAIVYLDRYALRSHLFDALPPRGAQPDAVCQ